MDPLNSYLGKMLLEEITPVVMVLSTSQVEDACRKNGLNFIEMLLPFSLFKRIDVPVRTASDQPYRLQMFKLRLVYASDVRQRSYEAAGEKLKQVVHRANQMPPSDLLAEPPQLETLLTKNESDLRPSWMHTFNKELIKSLSFSEHETFDHPMACLLVVSSKDERPINRFVDLFNTNQLPSLLNDGFMDPKILKQYVLLHDKQDGTTLEANNILGEMKSTFGANSCNLLCINSADDVKNEVKNIHWLPYANNNSFVADVARFLSIDDLNGIKDFMQYLASNHLIPYMEQKIRILNQQVSATRKGFRNQIKNLWWRKGKDDAPEAPNGPTYTYSSLESQIRLLGDLAFMLRDYELALSNYRLLSTDYKLDKAWKRYAGVQEMSGLAYFMLDQSRKDSEYCMENAFVTYSKLGSSGQRNATRCGLWWAEMLKSRGQFKEAASIYFRISNEEPSLHAAVMLEQAAYCYLLSTPPMLRKYGFHLVLAGNRYCISDERHHGIRAYINAIVIYKEKGWSYITDHVHFNVGRWYAFLGAFDVAIKHMLYVLACGHQSLATQNLFLNDFFHVVQNVGKKFEVYKLQLPVINMSSLKVIYEDYRTYASSSDASVSESIWQSLEEEMLPSMHTARSNWLDTQPAPSYLKQCRDTCICVAGEAIKVDLEFSNPLQISVSVSSVSLICELSAKSAETKTDGVTSTAALEDSESRKPLNLRGLYGDDSCFILSSLDFVLGGGETKKVQLEVTPRVEGMLTIAGVKWTLSDSVVGYQYFEFSANRKSKKEKKTDPFNKNLSFIVIKELPRLQGFIQHVSEKVYTGDLRLLLLELHNQSEQSVKNIKMKISHPRFLMPGDVADLNADFPHCLEKQSSESKHVQENTIANSKSHIFFFPEDTTLLGGTTIKWPLWFHAGYHGKISLYISIYYDIESHSSDMGYRILRMHYNFEVFPALDVSFHISPCLSKLPEFLVRMDVLNKTTSEEFYISQLSCVGDRWEISSLPSSVSISLTETLLSGQAMSCFFKLKDSRSNSAREANVTLRSDMLMGSEGDNELLIDVSRSPISDFHRLERNHQEKNINVDKGILDFILISKLHASNSTVEEGKNSKLLCNHACHCSITSKSPISWRLGGPRIVYHDFSSSFYEASLRLSIHNCSDTIVAVRVTTSDNMLEKSKFGDPQQSLEASDNGGWYDISLINDNKALSNVQGNTSKKSSSEFISPFVWSCLGSTKLNLEPSCTAEVPLNVCIFAPGTYDLSNYELHWKSNPSDGLGSDLNRWSSGSSQGHPFHLTVLQASQQGIQG